VALTRTADGDDDDEQEQESRDKKRRKSDQSHADADAAPVAATVVTDAAVNAASVAAPTPTPTPPASYAHAVAGGALLDLWDSCYVRDVRPLLSGCACHACRHHTRAYLHHLLKAKEMLGEILLYCHNQHQYVRLFDSCRRCEGEGEGEGGAGGEAVGESSALVAWSERVVKQMCGDV
jgi:hypothetical protein